MNYIVLEIVNGRPNGPVHQRKTRSQAVELFIDMAMENSDTDVRPRMRRAVREHLKTSQSWSEGDYEIHLLELMEVPRG